MQRKVGKVKPGARYGLLGDNELAGKVLGQALSWLAVLTASPIAVITAALPWPSTIIAVIEMSQSSCLVAGMLPDIERQLRKKQEPDPERLLGLLHRW